MATEEKRETTNSENNQAVVENPDSNVNVAQNEPQQQQQPQQESQWKTILFRMFIFYMIMNFFRGRGGQQQNGESTQTVMPATNLFPPNTKMELRVFLSENSYLKDFNDPSKLLWYDKTLKLGNWTDGLSQDGSREFHTIIHPSERVLNNGSLYLHVFVSKLGKVLDSSSPRYNRLAVVNRTKMLTVYKKRRVSKTVNLLSGKTDASPEMVVEDKSKELDIISYWHPNLTINMLDDQTPWTRGSVPPPMDEFVVFDNITNKYFPVLYLNNYWNLNSDYMPINDTTKTLELRLTYSPISLFKWQMYESQRMRQKWFAVLGDDAQQTDEEQDVMKRTLVETNPYLLGLTMIVTLVHSVFEFLAFKNDIQFWRSRKSLEGLSVRSVFFNVFQALIVLLYVLDNETNTVVIISCGVGLLIEMWKITKAVNISFDTEHRWFGVVPRIRLSDKDTYTQSTTKVYDQMAFKYLSWLLFPLLMCYAVYSLLYQEHKGWYSWILGMLYGFLLTFGFIMMTPQLFINYKLKSVAHLPWRMMTYKALNTFIDDIFAFVIKMPTMYRIGCFRDDVVFFIYLYQRWIYRIDLKRVNEFGYTGEDLTGASASTEQAAEPQPDESQQKSDKKND